jgi:predicted permease
MSALINVVIPVFGVILTGYVAARLGLLGADSAAALNRFVFYFAMPPALFTFAARAPVAEIFNWPFIGAIAGGALVTLLPALFVGRFWFRQDVATLGVAGFASGAGNVVFMGLPLLLTAYGPSGALPTIIAALCLTLLFFCSAIAVLEIARDTGSWSLGVVAKSIVAVFKNPAVISPLLGILFALTGLALPKAVSNYLDLMGAVVGPGALFALGLSLADRKVGHIREVVWLSTLKLIVNPLATFAFVTWVFVMDPFWAKAAVVLSAMPIAANVFVIAQQYKVHVAAASAAIVVSTGVSVVTISFVLILLGVG